MRHDKHARKGFLRNQRGNVLILVTGSIAGLFAFAVIAIDGAILMTTRNQLQCAADAAALAGASALKNGRGAATARAIQFAGYNFAVQDSLQQVVIDEADVTFPEDNRIRVRTHRTAATNDALRTYFLRFLDMAAGLSPSHPNRVDVVAYASAELVDNCAAECIKPWAIPDRWDDLQGGNPGVCDPPEPYTDTNGNGSYDLGEPFTDVVPDGVWFGGDYYDPVATGYIAPNDVGTSLDMHSSATPGPVAPGQYYSIALPPLGYGIPPQTGGAVYRQWIEDCAPYIVSPGDECLLEPGQMVGPTVQGCRDLIAQDPNAYWDPLTETIQNSDFGQSPRIALVPFYDPWFPPQQGRTTVNITKIGAFFLESVGPGSTVTGRFIQVTAPGLPCEENTGQTFVLGLHLVE